MRLFKKYAVDLWNHTRKPISRNWASCGSMLYAFNQDDLAERGAQVGIMNDILSSAASVLVWLGQWLPRTQQAVALLECLATIPKEKHDLMRRRDLTSQETYEELGIHHIDEEEWAILVSFMERNWYRRV
jgi:hypothetical protein